MSDRPLILICNDDGIEANGIHALASAMDGLGELMIAAPAVEQSAVGHAVTVFDPVRAIPWEYRVPSGPVRAFAITGTPADCIKLAMNRLVPRRPDLVVSGINQGPNTAVNVIYSGTVSAATEAAILGVDSVAFSLCDWDPEADFEEAGRIARTVAEQALKQGLPPGTLLNVNIPSPKVGVKGMRVTRQARSRWEEEFEERRDPRDRPYYWLGGTFRNLEEDADDTDLHAIDNGYVSVTPIHYDLTAYAYLDLVKGWDL